MTTIKTVAIIDDDEICQYATKRIICSTNSVENIQIYSNGLEAISGLAQNINCEQNLPDLIFLDLNMPILDGWQFLEQFKPIREKLNRNIPIYILSSSMNPEDLIQAKEYEEVSDYLIKPISEIIFIDILEKIAS